MRWWLGALFCMALEGVALADAPGALLGETLRYPHTVLPLRIVYDVAAIPLNVPRWDAEDALTFAALASTTVALMLPFDPSPDVRLDRFIRAELDPHVPDIWGVTMQTVLWSSLAIGGLGAWGVAWLTEELEVAESMSLLAEALAIVQIYGLSLKLLIGREGPTDGAGTGRILGPTEAPRLFPAGTPSGHFATFYAMLATLLEYYDPPWPVWAAGHVVVGGLAAMHVINHRHFLSDVVWGAGMGYAIGAWVVRHRSTRFEERGAGPARIAVVPWLSPEARGLAIAGAF